MLSIFTLRFVSIGKLLSPLLHLVLPQVLQGDLLPYMGNDVIEVLLAASKIGDIPSRQNALNTAAGILEGQSPEYLRGALAHQQSILSRLRADFSHSEHVIEEFCRRSPFLDCSGPIGTVIGNFYRCFKPDSVTKRSNAIYGRLHSSHLENLVQCDQYKTAEDEVDDWRTSYNPSLMEGRVLPGRKVTISKIYRSHGAFAEVRSSLESCLKILLPQDMSRIQVLCGLADVYCDLGLPEQAHAILAPEIKRNESRRGKMFRRLLVSAIDAELGLCLYENGDRAVREVEAIFNNLSNLDVIDQLLHVRVLVASARIAYYKLQFSEALSRWEIVLNYVQKYASFSGEGFTYAVIHLSICLAQLESGNTVEGWEAFQRAEKILRRGMRDFWIPTLATRWFPDILARLEELKGWKLYQKASQ
jgi:tetratricopeptide (TPR) repeat protein